jgi:DNA-binding NarL/FixJ family response regulator
MNPEVTGDLGDRFPVSRTIRTAPSRNSGSNFLRFSGMALLIADASSIRGELRDALVTLEALAARTAAALVRKPMKALGLKAIPRGPRLATRDPPAGPTAREQQVLALLAEGLPDREISRRLFISERTVHHHVSTVLAKTGVASRTAAAREAARMGIGSGAGAPHRS